MRPFVTPDEIDRTVRAAGESGAAVLCVPVVDTIKVIEGERIARTLPRETLRRALTPQCFHYELLRRAYETALSENLTATDDSALVERLGIPVAIVEGHPRNIKITRPEDFALAEVLLKEIEGDANTLGSASVGYGLGNYFYYNGDKEKAIAIFRKIVAGNQWASFGYIAAETELNRQRP